MEEKNKNIDPENEFKLFRQIEAAIEGVLDFIIRFIRTTVFLTLHPFRLKQLTSVGENDHSLSRPLTYLSIATVAFSPLARFSYRLIDSILSALVRGLGSLSLIVSSVNQNIGPIYNDSVVSPATILKDIPDFSADAILKVALPIILIITGLSAAVGTLTQRYNIVQRKSFIHSICYVAGFQFVIFSTSIIALIGLSAVEDENSTYSIIVIILSILSIIIWPTLLLFSVLYNTINQIKRFKFLQKILSLTSAFIISVTLLTCSSMVSIIPLFFETKPKPIHVYIWSVESFEFDGKLIKAHLQLTSNRTTPYYVIDNGMTLTISKKGKDFLSSSVDISTIPLELTFWSDYGRPLLEIKNGESKWLLVQGTFDDNTIQLLKNSGKNHYILEFRLKGLREKDEIRIEEAWNN